MYEKDIISELRLPTIANLEGARIGEIDLPYVDHLKWKLGTLWNISSNQTRSEFMKKAIFVHIPKCAGCSLWKALLELNLKEIEYFGHGEAKLKKPFPYDNL